MSEWLDGYMLLANVVVQTTVEGSTKPDPSWLQTYGQLIGVAVGTLMTGAVAIALAVMNNRSSDGRLRMQQNHDLQRENQRITRERLEDLYVLAGHWTSALSQYGILGLRLAKGLLTYRQYLEVQSEQGGNPQVQLPRMELLLNVYGSSEVNQAVAKLKDARTAFNNMIHIVERTAQSPDRLTEAVVRTAPVDAKFYAKLDQLVGDMGQAGRDLLEAIATQTKG